MGPVPAYPEQFHFWLAGLATLIGLGLSVWTCTLFLRFGEGTPAPWEPPSKLVVRGPYLHVRNPMISGVLLILTGEALWFQSWPIAGWTVVFLIGNAIYFPLVEEKELANRFGAEYNNYRANVPRWIPRLRPWKREDTQQPPRQ